MSTASVLFDAPGPKTIRRHRLYSVITVVVLVALLAFAYWRLDQRGQWAYELWEPYITPRYIQAVLVDGVLVTLQMAASAVVLSLFFGLIFGIAKLSSRTWVSWPAAIVVEFFRAVPVLMLMILVFFSFGITRGETGAYWSVVIALTLYNGAVLAEVFRAGINAVPQGQSEAAYALGLRKGQVTNLILLPQAVRIMLPSIISQCVVALKDTSLGFAVAAPGLTAITRQIYLQFDNQFQTMVITAMLYITMCAALMWLADYAQKRYLGDKNPLGATRGGPNKGGGANTGGVGL